MKLNEVTIVESRQSLVEAQMYESRKILIESMSGLTTKQRKVVYEFYNGFEPLIAEFKLMEATLTPDQIQQIFGNVEQGATASGSNRTMVGKGVDAAKLPGKVLSAIDNKINELGRMAQNSGPIKNIDAKFEELKKKISTDNPEVAKRIKAVSDWAKANPGKASLAVGILTTAAAFAAGPAGGAAAGFFLRSASDLLKGEKLSTAVGKAAKTAAYGALAGLTINYLSDKVVDAFGAAGDAGIENAKVAMQGENAKQAWDAVDPGVKDAFQEFGRVQPIGATIDLETPSGLIQIKIPSGFVPEDVYEKVQDLMNTPLSSDDHIPNLVRAAEMVQKEIATNPIDQDTMAGVFDLMTKKPEFFSELTADQLTKLANMGDDLQAKVDLLKDASKGIGSAIQGAIQAAAGRPKEVTVKGNVPKSDKQAPKEESVKLKDKKLSEGQVYYVFNQIDQYSVLMEAPTPKKDAQTASKTDAQSADAPTQDSKKKPGFFSRMGKNLTTKVTADKLNKAWKKAGSPTDSNELANFLRQQGVSDEVLTPVYKKMKLKVPAAPKQTDPNAKQDNATKAKDGATGQSGGTAGGKTSPTGQTGGAAGKKAAQGFSYNDVKAHIAKLTAKDKRRLLKYLGRSQPSSTTAKAPTKKPATQPAGIKQGGYQTTGPTA